MKKEPTNEQSNKLPEKFGTNNQTNKDISVVEGLLNAAILKLWCDRGFRDVRLGVRFCLEGRRFYVKIVAKNKEGRSYGVECVSSMSLARLRLRISRLRACLPPDGYVIVVFPYGADKKADKAVQFADEVWITGKDGKVSQMLFMSSLGTE